MPQQDIQKLYQNYSFIETHEGVGGEAVAGAITQWLTHRAHLYSTIKRTYENPAKWYFIVAKPFNKPYEKDPSWYLTKGLDAIRKKCGKTQFALFTRETDAAKVHINGLIVSDSLPFSDGYNTNKYKISVSALSGIDDRRRILDYITKESLDRTFIKYLDYLYTY